MFMPLCFCNVHFLTNPGSGVFLALAVSRAFLQAILLSSKQSLHSVSKPIIVRANVPLAQTFYQVLPLDTAHPSTHPRSGARGAGPSLGAAAQKGCRRGALVRQLYSLSGAREDIGLSCPVNLAHWCICSRVYCGIRGSIRCGFLHCGRAPVQSQRRAKHWLSPKPRHHCSNYTTLAKHSLSTRCWSW